jgi:hypothetical protein
MLDGFKGKPTIIAVAPGDYNTKYYPLDGWMKAHNRALNDTHHRFLLKNWDAELSGLVTLVVNETGDKTYIIDGQHRIAAASSMDTPQVMLARVYRYDEIPMNVDEWVTAINQGQKSFRLGDYLATHRSYSLWPDVFDEVGVQVGFNPSRTRAVWASVIRGARYGLMLLEKGQLVPVKQLRINDAITFWETEDIEMVRRVAHFVKWWTPFIKTAKNYRVGGITAATVMGLAFVIYEENKGNRALDKAKDRLLTWPSVSKITLYANGKEEFLPTLREALIFGMNRGARSRLLTCLGDDGRR